MAETQEGERKKNEANRKRPGRRKSERNPSGPAEKREPYHTGPDGITRSPSVGPCSRPQLKRALAPLRYCPWIRRQDRSGPYRTVPCGFLGHPWLPEWEVARPSFCPLVVLLVSSPPSSWSPKGAVCLIASIARRFLMDCYHTMMPHCTGFPAPGPPSNPRGQ